MRVKFLHSSDFQIGMKRWFLTDTDDAQPRFDAARKQAITALGDVAVAHDCEFVVVAGDIFEHNAVSEATKRRALEALSNLPVDVYLLPGNHDPLSADSILSKLADYPTLHVFTDATPFVAGEVEIIGAPWLTKHPMKDLCAEVLAQYQPTDRIRVLVAHGQTENRSNDIQPALINLKTLETALATGVIDYVALGDTHSAMPVGTSGAVWYSGSPEVTDFKELATGGGEHNSGKALVVEIEKTEGRATATVTEVQIGQWCFEAITTELYTDGDVKEFLEQLQSYPHKDQTVIKYALQGELDITTRKQLDDAIAALKPLFANLYPRTRLSTICTRASDDDITELHLTGFASEALTKLRQSPDPAAQDALNLLFRLSHS